MSKSDPSKLDVPSPLISQFVVKFLNDEANVLDYSLSRRLIENMF